VTSFAPNRRATLVGLAGTVIAVAVASAAPAVSPKEAAAMKPILVFDIAETIRDLSSLAPVFQRIFGDKAVLRTWFDELILYSEAMTLTGTYADAGQVGAAVLEMLAKARGVTVHPEDLATLKQASATMPAYPDVAPGLRQLRQASYRLVTLSNSPIAACETQLSQAGIRTEFERLFSIDEQVRRYKPARETYRGVIQALGVQPADLWLVSCHAFDVMGAASAGLHSALIQRADNAPFAIGPQPDIIVPDLPAFARALVARGGR
jgi:2-haloacid dehalogenase